MKQFTTVAQMKLAHLQDGQTITTQGYYAAGDDGQATYLIKTAAAYGGTPDEYGDHTLANGNIAVLQYSDTANVSWFGAIGDGVTDDYEAINSAINMAISTGIKKVQFKGLTYGIGTNIEINDSGVQLLGIQLSSTHDVSPTFSTGSTVLKWIGTAGGTIMTIQPTAGASNQRLDSIVVDKITFDGDSSASICFETYSCRNSIFDIYCYEATSYGCIFGVISGTLGEGKDFITNKIRYTGRQITNSVPSLWLKGGANDGVIGNVSNNWFELVTIGHDDATAIKCSDVDNNLWGHVRIFRAAGGTGNGITWHGGDATGDRSREETFLHLSSAGPLKVEGTDSGWTYPAYNIEVIHLDRDNNTPDLTLGTGATGFAHNEKYQDYTPVIAAGSGALTTAAATGRFVRRGRTLHFQIEGVITTNGTGASYISITLPCNNANTYKVFAGRARSVSGKMLQGYVAPGSNSLIIRNYDNTYPASDGETLDISGTIEVAYAEPTG